MIGEIICVGTELLLGDILNTNAQFLSRQLADLGISVYHQNVVGDNESRLLSTIKLADSRSDIIFLVGGLGPTSDDITKETVAKAYDKNIVMCQKTLAQIEQYFTKRNITMTENNKKTAYTIEGARLFDNHNGTAPGILLEIDHKKIILLPGPPNEMIPMFDTLVKPFLMEHSNVTVVSRTLRLVGIGESSAADKIQDLIDQSQNPTIAPYAKLSEVHLRITAQSDGVNTSHQLIDQVEAKVRERLNEYIYTNETFELEEIIIKQLLKENLEIATAESITGGLIASALINCDGASKVFNEGMITYSNQAKIDRLGVSKETLTQFGAVSKEVAKEMAVGICNKTGADVGISITGIAGPTGGTEQKPIGLTFIAVSIKNKVYVAKYELMGNRMKIRNNAAKKALIFVYEKLNDLHY